MSQKKMILKHLQSHGQITPIDALGDYGCFRLAARIAELRKDGINIKTDTADRGYAIYKMGGDRP